LKGLFSINAQVNHFSSDRVQSSSFNLIPLGMHRLQNLSGLDISRVQSDALPQSSLPSMVICGNIGRGSPGHGGESPIHAEGFSRGTAVQPKFLADAHSIDTNSMEDMEDCCTINDDGQKSLTLMPSESPARVSLSNKTAESQHGRPGSGPPHRTSGVEVLVSPAHSAGEAVILGEEEKRKSQNSEQQKRTSGAQENSLIARGGSLDSAGSMICKDGEEVLATPPASLTTTPSGATTSMSSITSPQESVSGNPEGLASGVTPFNLHTLTMDQTREVGMNQMFEIWKEVEESEGADKKHGLFLSHSPVPSSSPQANLALDHVDDGTKVNSAVKLPPPSQASPNLLERQRSEVLQMTDISISLDPVGQSTPYQTLPYQTPQATFSQSLQVVPREKLVCGATPSSTSMHLSPGGPDTTKKLKNRPTSFSNKRKHKQSQLCNLFGLFLIHFSREIEFTFQHP